MNIQNTINKKDMVFFAQTTSSEQFNHFISTYKNSIQDVQFYKMADKICYYQSLLAINAIISSLGREQSIYSKTCSMILALAQLKEVYDYWSFNTETYSDNFIRELEFYRCGFPKNFDMPECVGKIPTETSTSTLLQEI
ncbi:MAG: hypothetical protein AABY27_00615 [Pseudomonadota bacterium]